ncbi:MAG: cytochrome C [Nitrospinales bacterium]
MLPEQHDILWTFMSLAFSMFSIVAFANVVGHCRQRENVSTMFWGAIFGVIALVMMGMTNHLMGLIQGDQMAFLPIQVLWVFICLTTWGVFFKSTKIEGQSPPITRAFFFWTTVSILLAGYTNWLPQQRSDPPPNPDDIVIDLNMTMDQYVNMGRDIVFGSKPATEGNKAIGKGQCPLCHTFDAGDNIGRCPNLFGIEERSHTRIKEERYMTEPVKPGEEEPAAGIVKGRPDQIPEAYRRAGAGEEMTGEDYIRESMMCPSCYVVEKYGKAGDKVSPMPVISKPPIQLTPVEVNAVIAWLQSKDDGDMAKITVPLPSAEDTPVEEADAGGGDDRIFMDGSEPIDVMVNTLGCPLCHTIPGIEGAVGELGPKLHEKTNAPNRIKDARYKGKAKNTKEYVRESILNPGAFVVMNEEAGELFPDGLMPTTFSSQLSVDALDKLVDFISETEAK